METFVNFCLKMQNHFQEFLVIGNYNQISPLTMGIFWIFWIFNCFNNGIVFLFRCDIYNQHFALAHDVDLYSLYIVTSLKLGSNFRR